MKKINPILLFILVIGALIRLYNLGAHNLWFDEIYSLRMADTFNFSFQWVEFDPRAPFYYVLLHFWTICFGQSEFALRFLSFLFGSLSIALIYKVGKDFFNKEVGLVSAFILSLSPLHIWYAQEAREYTLATLLALLSGYLFFLVLKKDKTCLWIAFIGVLALSLYTNYFSCLIIFPATIIFLLKGNRRLLKHWLLACFIILLGVLPWLPIFLKHIQIIQGDFWIPKPVFKSIMITFENFNIGYNASAGIYILSSIVFFILFLSGIFRGRGKKNELTILLSFLFIPIIVTFFISQWIPIYLDRCLMLFSPFYYIIIAYGFIRIKKVFVRAVFFIVIFLSILLSLYNYFSYHLPLPQFHHIGVHAKKPVKPAADFINSGLKPRDAIIFSNISGINMEYYLKRKYVPAFIIASEGEGHYYNLLLKYKGTNPIEKSLIYTITLEKDRFTLLTIRKVLNLCKFKRIWLISSSWERDGRLYHHSLNARQWMDANYSIMARKEFEGIYVDLYSAD